MLHTLGLRANRLSFKSLNTIFTHVNLKGFRHMDISLNDMSGSAVSTLCDLIMRSDCRMSSLELEKTNLTRQSIQKICRALTFPETSWIMELSLSRNGLDSRSMVTIAEVLKYPGEENRRIGGNMIEGKGRGKLPQYHFFFLPSFLPPSLPRLQICALDILFCSHELCN